MFNLLMGHRAKEKMRWKTKEERVEPIAGQRLGGFLGLSGGARGLYVLSFPPCSRRPNLCWFSVMTGGLGTKPAGLGR